MGDFAFISIYPLYPACTVFNWIGFILFLCTTGKSIYDLIVSEIIHKDTPLTKISFRKLFHFLLPLSQGFFCVSCIRYSMYCVDIEDQEIVNTCLTSIGGYILVICFLCNALHWAFLTSQSNNLKRMGCLVGVILVVFVIIPFTFEVAIIYYKNNENEMKEELYMVHLVELAFASTLNIIVTVVVFFSWFLLNRRLKEFSGLHTINKLKTRLTIQMSLYIVFFFIRATCMLVSGVMGYVSAGQKNMNNLRVRLTLFFASAVFGDIPLAIVMLVFLQHRQPSSQQASSGGGQPNAQSHYQYTAAKINTVGDNSPPLSAQINPTNDIFQSSEIIFTNTPPYYSDAMHAQPVGYPQNSPYFYSPQIVHPGMDPSMSTNSFYTPESGYV